MKNFLSRNLGLKILSLLIALLLFSAAPGNKEVLRREVFTVPLQVLGDDLAKRELILGSPPPETVRVVLRGTNEALQDMNTQDIKASIDLSDIESAGIKSIPVHISGLMPNVTQEQEIMVSINVDHLLNKTVPVEVSLQGEYEGRFYRQNPETAILSGPASVVEKITQGLVLVSPDLMQDANGYLNKALEIQWVDAQGHPVNTEYVKTSAQYIEVTIYSEKEVPIRVNLAGEAAEGYRVVEAVAVPGSIRICGKPQVLAMINEMETLTVDVSGLSASKTLMVGLREYDGIFIGPGQPANVEVLVRVDELASRTFEITDIEAVNVPEGFRAVVQDETVSVTLRGVASVLDAIAEDMLYVEVDMSGARLGSRTYPIRVRDVPEGVDEVEADPARVTVTVTSS